ncbi:polyprenyl synthetase family protein [Rhodothermus profundi]|uniref:Geranylgeranyl diphosphate synthase, type II n=1 Tax=Rhodothermus profundi TaxID=633813 RepID=A0A1M6Q0H4_9BACT|nr:polyprenyl synthetase family protein [Rhodothermus profundi]SHK13684.1 geranylgeranyl diphosphate synthase, type II [Rhodothermus profundi]
MKATDREAAAHVAQLRQLVEQALPTLVHPAREPAELYEPVRYVLRSTGKRMRPVLLLLTAELYGRPPETVLPAALAVEVFHAFTLVHDDIMDHAAERRGRPTVHVRWDEATALLCGDYLMGLAYALLGQVEGAPLARMLALFHRMVERLCEGQALDKAFETRPQVSVAEYLQMVDGKTGALLELCLQLGGLLGGANEADLRTLEQLGRNLGRAFQIQDDLLDLTATSPQWGKPIGADLMEGKKTFPVLAALEQAPESERAWFTERLHRRFRPDEVPEARRRLERLGGLEAARQAVATYLQQARSALARLPDQPPAKALAWFLDRLEQRRY